MKRQSYNEQMMKDSADSVNKVTDDRVEIDHYDTMYEPYQLNKELIEITTFPVDKNQKTAQEKFYDSSKYLVDEVK